MRSVRLVELAEIVTGSTPSSGDLDCWGDHLDFVTPSDQVHGSREAVPARRLSKMGVEHLRSRVVPKGATLLTCIGSTIGKVSRARERTVTNQQINSIVARGSEADSGFMYYLISNWSGQLRSLASGSATPIVNKTQLEGVSFLVPPLREQQAIAEVLGALDDKIAANRRTLEVARQLRGAHARRLVDADRKKQRLDEVTVFLGRGKAPAYTEDPEAQWVINQKCVRDGAVSLSEARRTSCVTDTDRNLRFGDVLVNSTGMGTLGRVGIWTGTVEATVDSHVTIVRFDASAYPLCYAEFVLAAEQAITALGEGSTGQTELSRALLRQVELPKLNSEAFATEVTLQSLHQMESALRCESERLAQLRDILLPALMDGTLRVKDAVAQAEEVL